MFGLGKSRATTAFVTLFDCVLAFLCMYAVMRLRYIYEGKIAPNHIDIKAALVFAASCVLIWTLTRVNRAVWRFVSFDDVRRLLSAVVIATILTPVILFLFFDRAANLPRSAPFLAGVFFFAMLVLIRAMVMFYHNGDIRALFQSTDYDKPQALLVGRGQTLHNVLREILRKKNEHPYAVRGLIEIDGSHQGRSISGVPVIGNFADITGAVAEIKRQTGRPPTLVFVDTKSERKKAAALVRLASELGTPVVRMRAGANEGLTPFEAADLIGRQAKSLDMTPVQRFIKGKRVLITGAGGTIGSELAQQVAGYEPAHMALVDSSEMHLYLIDRLFTERGDVPFTGYLGDVRNRRHMDEIFATETPDIVLHAAALKHVPLMETNPLEAVRTNVGGTQVILDMAKKHGVQSFTLISTDKAVYPNNIMGASKRIAEMLTMAESINSPKLASAAVRFGNVLASNGSVIPLFERQIENGGPVTVTHKDVTRFFMTTGEAASLVLQAAALNSVQREDKSAIYVLDMGDPVSIASLARQLIRLRGFVPDKDIQIKFTGLRPGEKLREELTGQQENLESTYVTGVLRFTGTVTDPKSITRRVNKLIKAAEVRHKADVRTALLDLVPEFEPNAGLSPDGQS